MLTSPALIVARQGPALCDPTRVGRSTAAPECGPDTAAALCQGVDPLAWASARLAWGADARGLDALERALYLAAIDLAIAQRWPQPPKGSTLVRRLVHLALYEAANPGGFWWQDDVGRVRLSWNGETRARLLGMKANTYRKRWARCYEDVYHHLDAWMAQAARRIRANALGEVI